LAHKVKALVSFYLLNKMLRYVEIILIVQFSKYLESFSTIWTGIYDIYDKQLGLLFIELPCSWLWKAVDKHSLESTSVLYFGLESFLFTYM